jgi:conjugal transfer pilus assembly protein TraF
MLSALRGRCFERLVCALWLAVAATPLAAQAESGFFSGSEDGWFWYKDPNDARLKKKPADAPAAPKPDRPEETPFSVAWLRKNMSRLLESAIDDPKKENVEAYLYAQRIAFDKAQNYANMTQKVVYSDPYLDENNRVPMSTFARPFFLRAEAAAQNDGLKYLAERSGLWLFYDSKCDMCRLQAYTIEEIRKQFPFPVKYISLDGRPLHLPSGQELPWVKDNGHVALLKLKVAPTTVLVSPPATYMVVSQGAMAQNQLTERILAAAENQALLPNALLKKIRPYDRGVLKSEDMQKGAGDDPRQWVQYLKDKLGGRY